MEIGIIKEIKGGETRVAMTPQNVSRLLKSDKGHRIYIERYAGLAAGYHDEDYITSGAKILPTAKEIFNNSRLIVHVKEPQFSEYELLNKQHILFTYLHLSANLEITKNLINTGCTAFAYETLTDNQGRLPLLAPMSRVAGKMAFVYALYLSQSKTGGTGKYPGSINSKTFSKVVIIGGGNAGISSAESFTGIGADVAIIEKNPEKRLMLKEKFPMTTVSDCNELRLNIQDADIIIGSILAPGAKAEKMIGMDDIKTMKKGAVIIDICIDQGGITEVSRPTSIDDPYYSIGNILLCCIPNIPATVPNTSTNLLTDTTIPYISQLADKDLDILKTSEEFRSSLNIHKGKCVHKTVAESLGIKYTPIDLFFPYQNKD